VNAASLFVATVTSLLHFEQKKKKNLTDAFLKVKAAALHLYTVPVSAACCARKDPLVAGCL
jgi:hypothetical protein